jgi:son of sevenless
LNEKILKNKEIASSGVSINLNVINNLFGKKEDNKIFFSNESPESILPLVRSKNFSLLDWSPIEIARQITLIEYEIFRKIQPNEFFNLGWSKKNKGKKNLKIIKKV